MCAPTGCSGAVMGDGDTGVLRVDRGEGYMREVFRSVEDREVGERGVVTWGCCEWRSGVLLQFIDAVREKRLGGTGEYCVGIGFRLWAAEEMLKDQTRSIKGRRVMADKENDDDAQ
ncbi:hypothetical protein Tco_1030417 [Tanacetum coccineum]|uniref:Uncharacterized protein n=1 Tax=Tanacetum coccineum TaxID=301880 RepID=A0ABQ5G656_9ASTR